MTNEGLPDNASWYKEDDSPKDKGESFHEV